MQAKYGKKRQWVYIFQGVLIIFAGVLLITFKQAFISWVSEIVALILLLDGITRILNGAKRSRNKNELIVTIVIAILEFVFAGILSFHPSRTVVWLIKFIGFYHALLGFINTISLYLLVKNKANNVFQHAFMTVVHIVLSIIAFSANESRLTILNLMGAYMILIGLTYIQDGRRVFISEHKEDKIRRRIRFPLPIFLSFLIPHRVLVKINRFLGNEFITPEIRDQYMLLVKQIEEDKDNLEILIHTSRYGIGIVGHVNIAYQGYVYNFGNHDKASRYLFGAIGDGVLAIVEKSSFIELSMAAGDTIFEFDIVLTNEQRKALEAKLDQMRESLVPWKLESEEQKKSYAGLLKRRADADLYKFTSGKFKNYFVFGTNCVQLTDEIIGISGLDLFAMVGFLTPGTYFDYLNREYKKDGSIVVGRHVHNRKLRKEMKALGDKSA